LTHSSGIPDYHREIPELRQPAPFIPTDQVIEIISRKPLHFIPGEQFRYSNSGYYLLGHIIEKVSGESYGSFLRANIFSPLGMKDTGLDDLTLVLRHRAIGYVRRWDKFLNALFKQTPPPYADAGLYSTVEDLLRWDQALYTERLISEKSLAAMLSPLIGMSITAPWGIFNGNYGSVFFGKPRWTNDAGIQPYADTAGAISTKRSAFQRAVGAEKYGSDRWSNRF
jgi:CubicO group peptidase (beta-lactamase class C family)